jgi:tyrosyl-tRNA synthetase
MQAADIFTLGVHIAHAGMDQRKAHVIARDVATHMRIHAVRGIDGAPMKPVALHHPLLLGLRRPSVWPVPPEAVRDVFSAMKMSKSDPSSAVFVHDSPDEINTKIRKAFCPPGEVIFNPILDWIDKLIFGIAGGPFVVNRTEANGGRIVFDAQHEVVAAYVDGSLHPMDAKAALAERLIDLLEPAREHFARPEIHAMLEEIDAAIA